MQTGGAPGSAGSSSVGCRLLGVQLVEAHLDDVIFRDCNLESAVFASAVFKAARFEGCVLRGALFEGADLRGVVFARCDLTNADLQGANLRGADLRGSLLDGLRIGPKDVQGAIIDPSQAVQVAGLLGLTVKAIRGSVIVIASSPPRSSAQTTPLKFDVLAQPAYNSTH